MQLLSLNDWPNADERDLDVGFSRRVWIAAWVGRQAPLLLIHKTQPGHSFNKSFSTNELYSFEVLICM